MKTKAFKDVTLPRLGFGAMRLPQAADGSIDKEQVGRMVDCAMEHGVNYFDTAWPYHGGLSEVVLGEVLQKYPRKSYFLADKFPGHQIAESYDPAGVFERQLRKCKVDYFDFYLLHNVYEKSIDVYMDPKWGIGEYFVAQRAAGRIKHLGFSSHAEADALEAFVDTPLGREMEFCQIQLNYLDWSLQDARRKCEILASRGIAIWVMEPLRGGALAKLAPVADAFRWLVTVPDVTMILSGMSTLEQMQENISIFESIEPLSGPAVEELYAKAESLKQSVPCTACRYCCSECPQELDIPSLIHSYNDLKLGFSFTPIMKVEALPEEKRPASCLGCGACAQACPQGIDIPSILADFSKKLSEMPTWENICRERIEAARNLPENA